MKNDASQFVPEINIKYGKLLDPIFVAYSQLRYPDWIPPPQEEVIGKVKAFEEIWREEGSSLLEQICAFVGFGFKRDILDVYIVSGTPRDMSDPIILRSRYEPDEFIDMVLHELLHRLLVINGVQIGYPFKHESKTVKNHIFVFAILTHLYKNILNNTQRLDAIIENDSKFPEYKKAWDIVGQEGYEKLIEECKQNARV